MQTDQVGVLLKHYEGHLSRHDAIVSLIDRNHAKICDVYGEVQASSSTVKEAASGYHTSAISILERMRDGLTAHESSSREQQTEILKVCGSTFLSPSLSTLLVAVKGLPAISLRKKREARVGNQC